MVIVGQMLKYDWRKISYEEIYNTLGEKIKKRQKKPNLKSTVSELVTEDGCKVYLVGTIHFSKESIQDVKQLIQEVQPDAVVLELCQSRESLLILDEQSIRNEARTFDLHKTQQSIKQFGLMQTLWLMLFLKTSAYLIEQLGITPGGEFREAFRTAQKIPFCNIYLGDQPILVTLRRCAATLSFWDLMKAFIGLVYIKSQPFPHGKMIVKQLKEAGKENGLEIIKMALEEYPEFYHVFISERDAYLTQSLKQAAKPIVLPKIFQSDPQKVIPSVVVGVVGIGHVPGITKNWNKQVTKSFSVYKSFPDFLYCYLLWPEDLLLLQNCTNIDLVILLSVDD
ncbi:traB domain-containing protein-like [Scyliorhinus canicula]|uniref:traB domain-containing protein-like n=1 Tax=Scyliorhinus canicula TaxID=7830 RepID=UPI0018F4BF1E|nr:traB domain-containing protein-like [Scyliorhinus canicula]